MEWTDDIAAPPVQVLPFTVGGRRLALPVALVREVAAAVAIDALPEAPPMMEGVINVRGELAPVFDLRRRLGVATAALHPDQRMIVAHAGRRLVVLRVDEVSDLRAIDAALIANAESAGPGVRQVAGLALQPDGVLVIYDLEQCLSEEEAARVDAAVDAAQRARLPQANRAP